jgi:hypothetical protein
VPAGLVPASGWTWAGTEHFVQTDERLPQVRDWLLSLFQALQGKDRAAIIEGIQNVSASFPTVQAISVANTLVEGFGSAAIDRWIRLFFLMI